MRKYLDRWARQLVRRGLRSGLIEGSNVWLSIGAVAWLFRLLSRRPPAVVTTERLRLGESVVVSHVPAPPRSRRAKKKAARKASELERRGTRQQARLESSRRYTRARDKKSASRTAPQADEARRKPPPRTEDLRERGRAEPVGRSRSEGDEEEPA